MPISTSERKVSVMLGKCGVSMGKCEKECAVISVVEHTQCGCDCDLKHDQCTASGQHIFRPDHCACECKDIAAKRDCLEQASGSYLITHNTIVTFDCREGPGQKTHAAVDVMSPASRIVELDTSLTTTIPVSVFQYWDYWVVTKLRTVEQDQRQWRVSLAGR